MISRRLGKQISYENMVLSMERWRGKVAIVTGASSGIGAATVQKLVTEGLTVVGLARRVERISQLAEKLRQEKGKLHAIKCDVSKEEDILSAFKYVRENLGPVYVLINNAGVLHNTDLSDGDTEKWRNILEVNVLGLSIATREAIRNMKANNIDGHIIHINSITGHQVFPRLPLAMYGASKFGVTSLTEALRQELNAIKSRIKISSISPGVVDTEIFERGHFSMDLQKVPHLTSEDIADAVAYVLSTPVHVQITELTIRPINESF